MLSFKPKKAKQWTRLDNAGKIFPCTSSKRDTKVFRLSCELNDCVNQKNLQIAVELTLKQFPIYKSVLKKGLFWYYMEQTDINPVVRQEYKSPCSPLYIHNKKNLLFEVSYFKNRINLDVYHAVSDGAGAVEFLQTVLVHYLCLEHNLDGVAEMIKNSASANEKMEDSFKMHYNPINTSKKEKHPKAYHVRSPKLKENGLLITEGVCDVSSVLKKAKEYNTTLTVYLCSILLVSIYNGMPVTDYKKPVSIAVPVNLRNFFKSESVRNFFGVMNVSYNFANYSGNIQDVIDEVSATFKKSLTTEWLQTKTNGYINAERYSRPVPLFIKDIVLKMANKIVDSGRTASLSNIGKLDIPKQLQQYINRFAIYVSTSVIQLCVCSFNDKLNIAFSSAYVSTDVQMHFYRYLTSQGIDIEITTNQNESEMLYNEIL